jgi:hypothetical protein
MKLAGADCVRRQLRKELADFIQMNVSVVLRSCTFNIR